MNSQVFAAYVEQATVTNWPLRIALVVAMLAVIGLALWGMRRGWVNRQARQADVPAPLESPTDPDVWVAEVQGVFIGTSRAGDWLDRIAVHDLGIRSRATVHAGSSGVWIEREAARSCWIPREAVLAVRLDRGVSATARSKESVIIIQWQLGGSLIETGFRADESDGQRTVLDGLVTLGYPTNPSNQSGAGA